MNALETRLAEALTARADQLEASDLAPAAPPAVVTPLRRRRPVVAGVAAAALVAAAAVVAVAVSSDDPTSRSQGPGYAGPSATATDPDPTVPTTAPAPPTRPSGGARGLFVEDDPQYAEPGTTVTYDDGTSAVVSADSSTLTLTDEEQNTFSAALEVAPDGSPNLLSRVQLQLGQAGTGLVVRYGSEYAHLTVLNLRSGVLTPAAVTGGVPLGNGFTEGDQAYYTWLSSGSLRTRVSVGTPDEQRYDVYTWELTGPGEGGGQPDSDVVDLVPVDNGTYCLDGAAGTARRCGGSDSASGSAGGAELLPEDEVDQVEAGTSATFADGSVGDLVPTGGGFDLEVTIDGVALRTGISRVYAPRLDTQVLRVGDALGYLVREESGDSEELRVFVISGGDLVPAGVTGDVPFANGFLEDGSRIRTYPAGGGTALYTAIYADAFGDGPPVAVYSWDLLAPQAELRPTRIG